MGRAIGIDLGTTNSVMAVVIDGRPEVIQNSEGGRLTPSVVAIQEGKRIVGQLAKRVMRSQAGLAMGRILSIGARSVKRFIGRRDDELETPAPASSSRARGFMQSAWSSLRDRNGAVRIRLGDEELSPQEISAEILHKLKQDASKALGDEVTDAVITVPASFNHRQREATKEAARIADLNVLRIINEPTAAALAYAHRRSRLGTTGLYERQLIYDLGGGTFDVSIVDLFLGKVEVLATGGDTSLGGDDFDRLIAEALMDDFHAQNGIDLRYEQQDVVKLMDAAEEAKRELSTLESTLVEVHQLAVDDPSGPVTLSTSLTRERLEKITDVLVRKTLDVCQETLESVGMSIGNLNRIVLVGGQARMPLVERRVTAFFGQEPFRDANPDEVVALGAALLAEGLSDRDGGEVISDVTPLSLSTNTIRGASVIVPRNTPLPARATETFTTVVDYQKQVHHKILEGESKEVDENSLLGEFTLEGIERAQAGIPSIEVTYEVSEEGILRASSTDLRTGSTNAIRVETGTSLDDEEFAAARARVTAS